MVFLIIFYDIDFRCEYPVPGDARRLRIQRRDRLHRMRPQRHLAITLRMLGAQDVRRATPM